MNEDKKQLIQKLTNDPSVRAFFNQQVHHVKPYLLATGTCGVQIELPENSDLIQVVFFYDTGTDTLRIGDTASDVYTATIKARMKFEEALGQILNASLEKEPASLALQEVHIH